MARNGSGNYTKVNTFTAGTPITAASHNQNWDDVAAEITNSVAADGQTTMTGPLKAASGSASAPSHTFGADPDTGGYRSGANEYSIAAGGVQITKTSSAGLDIKSGNLLIAGAVVSPATLANGAGLSVLGVTGNTSAARADIAADVDGYVLRRSGTALAFGPISTAGISDAAVTLAKQANLDSGQFIVRYTASTGVPQAGSFGSTLALNTSTGVLNVAAPSARVLIASATASSSSTLSFTSGIDASYREYVFALDNVLPATSGAALGLQVSTDGGSNWKTTSYLAANFAYSASASLSNSLPTTYVPITSTAGGGFNPANSAGYGISCELSISSPSNTTSRKVINVRPHGYLGSGGVFITVVGASGYWDGGNDAINAVRFLYSSGNIASGSIYLYGIKAS